MKHFTGIADVDDIKGLVRSALDLKKDPLRYNELGKHTTLGLIFLNASLRTRLSTQKAAMNLGMQTMVMNLGADGWTIETGDGVVMDGPAAEHINEAIAVIGQYCDIIGIRSFGKLENREEDYKEVLLNKCIERAGVPVISLESATLHPLQSLADMMTIEELKTSDKPKIVLTWVPHPKPLLQAVPNSFAQWMNAADCDFYITHPDGYELDRKFADNAHVVFNQDEALRNADFVYAKNWSSYKQYGKVLSRDSSWMITMDKMALTNNGRFMHCLPVRRNVIVTDEVLDSDRSVVIQQAGNRVFAAQAVLKEILETLRADRTPPFEGAVGGAQET